MNKPNLKEFSNTIMINNGIDEIISKDVLKLPNNLNQVYMHFPKNLYNSHKIGDYRFHGYIMENLLSHEECDKIIKDSQGRFAPSKITTQDSEPDKYFRTSHTYNFDNTIFNNHIDNKISNFMNIPNTYSELTQVQYYDVGNEFKAHIDYFIPNTNEWDMYAAEKGQRTWTVTVYLNDVENGGTTDFVNIGLKVKPQKGSAVIWNNLYKTGEGNPDSLHTGTPVISGNKYIITKWYRDTKQ